jgi:peptide/nickel transport system ATP-binding protein
LSCEPRALLADEPTTALDVIVQAQIMDLLHRLCEEQGLALILVSHDLPLVAQVCDRINVMYAGEVVEQGTVDQLYERPAHPYTRLLLAATPDLDSDAELMSIPGTPPRLDRPVIGCSFHPRCDSTLDRCLREAPRVQTVALGHEAACHLNDQPSPTASIQVSQGAGAKSPGRTDGAA